LKNKQNNGVLMENFEFLLKTKIYFGRDEEKRVGEKSPTPFA
jgi:alcohol dehydrogenase YqhD (iron-dependent ADH family)